MSLEENRERRESRIGFRTSLDIGMGIFYVAIGTLVVYYRAMGAYQIPLVAAYVLGGVMIIGGAARFYRGIKVVLPKKEKPDQF
jgi:hypothetical protein